MKPSTVNLFLKRKKLFNDVYEAEKLFVARFGRKFPKDFDQKKNDPTGSLGSFSQPIMAARKALNSFHSGLDDGAKTDLRGFIKAKQISVNLIKKHGGLNDAFTKELEALPEDVKNSVKQYRNLKSAYISKKSDEPYAPAQKHRARIKDFSDPDYAADYLEKNDTESDYVTIDGKTYGRKKGSSGPMQKVDPTAGYYTNPTVPLRDKLSEGVKDFIDVRTEAAEGIAETEAAALAMTATAAIPYAGPVLAPFAGMLAGGVTSALYDQGRDAVGESLGVTTPQAPFADSFGHGAITSLLPVGKMGMLSKTPFKKGANNTLEKILLNKYLGKGPTRNFEREMAEKARQPLWGAVDRGFKNVSAAFTGISKQDWALYAAEKQGLLELKAAGTLDKVGRERLHELQVRLSDISSGMTDTSYGSILAAIKAGDQLGDPVDLSKAIGILEGEANTSYAKYLRSNNPIFKERGDEIMAMRKKYFVEGQDYTQYDQVKSYDLMRKITEDLTNFDARAFNPDDMIGKSVRASISEAFPSYVRKTFDNYSNMANINTAIKRQGLGRSKAEYADPDLMRTFEKPEYQTTGSRNADAVNNRADAKQRIVYSRQESGMPFQGDELLDKGHKSLATKESDQLLENILAKQEQLGMDRGPTLEAQDLYNKLKVQKQWLTEKSDGGGFPKGRSNLIKNLIAGGAGGAGLYYGIRSMGAEPALAAISAAGILGTSRVMQSPRLHQSLLNFSKGSGKTLGSRLGPVRGMFDDGTKQGLINASKFIKPVAQAGLSQYGRGASRTKIGDSAYDNMFNRQPIYKGQ